MTAPRFAIVCLCLFSLFVTSSRSLAQPDADADAFVPELKYSLALPLTDGKVDAVTVLAATMDQVGLDGDLIRQHVKLDWSFEATGMRSRVQFALIERATSNVLAFEPAADRLLIHVDRLRLRRMSRDVRVGVRSLVKRWLPEQAAKAMEQYGFDVRRKDKPVVQLDDTTKLPHHVVVLIHGLDDPGTIFNDLIPVLIDRGETVCVFTYPNDQPIEESADLLHERLPQLRAAGAQRITVIAHSMGGLVIRDTLTREAHYAGRGRGHDKLPDVVRLIMVGTPNHGSELARLRLGAEARDQVVRMLSGEGLLFGSIFDGAGEAQIDLLPGSEFLQHLNRRPLASGVQYSIIAGNASPVTDARLAAARLVVSKFVDPEHADTVDATARAITQVSEGLGDGCVSLESAKLKGVDDYTVLKANHVSLLNHRLSIDRSKPPVAVPLILERLRGDGEAGLHTGTLPPTDR